MQRMHGKHQRRSEGHGLTCGRGTEQRLQQQTQQQTGAHVQDQIEQMKAKGPRSAEPPVQSETSERYRPEYVTDPVRSEQPSHR